MSRSLPRPPLVHRRLHVVIDPARRYSAQRRQRVIMRIKQHLMALQEVRSQQKRPAVTELHMRHL